MSIGWPLYLIAGFTVLAVWRANLKLLRPFAVTLNLIVLGQHFIYLANVGRNTFEHVVRNESSADTFHAGVFAEAKAAEAFAREQLVSVYVAVVCLTLLSAVPRGATRPTRTARKSREEQ